tara:strand:+ start:3568 stop:4833 length:1266 start_codon:yes stop_codon:yes gene_type:complete
VSGNSNSQGRRTEYVTELSAREIFSMITWGEYARIEREDHRRVNFKMVYVDMADDLMAGLLLSQIVYWHSADRRGQSRLRVKKDEHFWIAKARHEWWDEIRLKERQVDRAIGILEQRGLVATSLHKFNGAPTTHIRLDEEVFMEQWLETMGVSSSSDNSDLTNPLNGFASKCRIHLPQTGKSITETTTETTTEENIPQSVEKSDCAQQNFSENSDYEFTPLSPEGNPLDSGSARFKCSECSKPYKTKGGLTRHLNKVHGIDRVHPAIRAYQKATGKGIAQAGARQVVTDTVGTNEADVEMWMDVVVNWNLCGWKPTSVSGMLEYYRKRAIPRTGSREGIPYAEWKRSNNSNWKAPAKKQKEEERNRRDAELDEKERNKPEDEKAFDEWFNEAYQSGITPSIGRMREKHLEITGRPYGSGWE